MNLEKLDAAIRAVCPIHGVNSNCVISFKDEATKDQRASAQTIADGWDFATPDAEELADEQAVIAAKSDNVINYLVTHTPAECAAYVAANVNNLADAKAFLGKVAMALSMLTRQHLR